MPLSFDSKVALVDRLGSNHRLFNLSCLIFKNAKALLAIKELGTLKNELYDFAKDPNVSLKQLGPPPPKPNLNELSEEEAEERKAEYTELMEQWETMRRALSMGVRTEDHMAIEHFMEPYEETINATPAVKGKRWHSLTKTVNDEQGGGFSLFKRGGAQQPQQ